MSRPRSLSPPVAAPDPGEATLTRFASKHRLKTRVDVDETKIIPGRNGHVYEDSPARLGVLLMFRSPKPWGHRRRAGIAAGMELYQDGESEGSLLFDPAKPEQARVAISIAGIKKRRIMSAAQKEVLARAMNNSPIGKRGAGLSVVPKPVTVSPHAQGPG